jgi:hypothetical protein
LASCNQHFVDLSECKKRETAIKAISTEHYHVLASCGSQPM